MGGDHGHGPVVVEVDEPLFHAEWEGRVLALNLAAAANGCWNIDQSRFARENTPPTDYLSRSYYETWLYGLEKLVVETGMVSTEELESARSGESFEPVTAPPLTPVDVEAGLLRGNSTRMQVQVEASFVVGQRVQASSSAPAGHTRVPRYVRGHVGTVERDHGVFIFADSSAGTGEKNPQHLYAVRFEASELWGDDTSADVIYVDLWDDHLEAFT
jgi:nitrile hydratase subunit beta